MAPRTSPQAMQQCEESFPREDSWSSSLARVTPAILVIRVSRVRAFDGAGASHTFATGFVVDAERGIVLSNRHVVSPGPTTADAITVNKEEIPLEAIYRDPVHDFGFYRLKAPMHFTKVVEIPLNPEGAKIGTEIRVVGNDNAEKLSILPGILSRVDREAPQYGASSYNDFNTFYIAAASNTSGGSSGSPVLTKDGVAVALNCGAATKAASAFYLPLHRVQRALNCLQRGEMPVRGTLQTIFKHTAFDEVRRLGLDTETEAAVRQAIPEETGMLVVEQVLPCGPADGLLEPGDILLRLGGGGSIRGACSTITINESGLMRKGADATTEPAAGAQSDSSSTGAAAPGLAAGAAAGDMRVVTSFLPLAEALDGAVGADKAPLRLEVQRGAARLMLEMKVQDLEDITPSELLQVSAGVVHPLSYQQARNYHMATRGVYVAQMGYMFSRAGLSHHCIVESLGPTPTPDLDAFEAAFRGYPDGARVALSYTVLGDRHRSRTAVITVDRRWFSCCRYRRGGDGLWRPQPPLPPLAPPPLEPQPREDSPADEDLDVPSTFASRIQTSLASVSFDVPYQVDGITERGQNGVGVVLDAELGLLVVDRQTVPIALGDALITFGAALEVPGEVLFLHPVHNFAILGFDAAAVRAAGVRLEAAPLLPQPLAAGKQLEFYGVTASSKPVFQRPVVTKLEHLEFGDPSHPLFTARNMEVVFVDRVASCLGGVLCGAPDVDKGANGVAAFYFCFNAPGGKLLWRGMPSHFVQQALEDGYRTAAATAATVAAAGQPAGKDDARTGRRSWAPPRVKYVPIGLIQTPVSEARAGLGLAGRWPKLLREHRQSQLLTVRRCMASVAPTTTSPATAAAASGRGEHEAQQQHSVKGSSAAPDGTGRSMADGDGGGGGGSGPSSSSPLGGFETGDVLLTVNGKLVTNFVELEEAARSCGDGASSGGGGEEAGPTSLTLPMTVLRKQQEVAISAPVVDLPPLGTDRIVLWAGLMLQVPHLSVLELGFLPEVAGGGGGGFGRGVYVGRWSYGSPSQKYGAGATIFVTSVNGKPTPCLDSFLEVVKGVGDGEDVRLKIVDLNAKASVLTMKTDLHYWPTADLRRVGPGRWEMRNNSSKSVGTRSDSAANKRPVTMIGASSADAALVAGAAAAADTSAGCDSVSAGSVAAGSADADSSFGPCDSSGGSADGGGDDTGCMRARWELRLVESIKPAAAAAVPQDEVPAKEAETESVAATAASSSMAAPRADSDAAISTSGGKDADGIMMGQEIYFGQQGQGYGVSSDGGGSDGSEDGGSGGGIVAGGI